MTTEEYLSGIQDDENLGAIVVERAGYGTKNVLDIRGFGYLEKIAKLPNVNEFQDNVGIFIVQSVKEKIERDTHAWHNKMHQRPMRRKIRLLPIYKPAK